MEQISNSFREVLNQDFGDLKRVEKILKKKEFFKFSNYSISQQAQLFNQEKVDVLNDSHVKKHYNKILDIFFLEFGDLRSKVYFNYFFTPLISSGDFEKRKKVLEKLDGNFEDKKKFKELFLKLKDLNVRPRFSKRVVVFNEVHSQVLYDEFKIVCEVMSQKEFIQISEDTEYLADLIVVCDEFINSEVQQYKFKDFIKVVGGKVIWENRESIFSLLGLFDLFFKQENSKDILVNFAKEAFNLDLNLNVDLDHFRKVLQSGFGIDSSSLIKKVEGLSIEVEKLNLELKNLISEKKVSLEGDELLELLKSGDVASLQKKVEGDTTTKVFEIEKKLNDELKELGFGVEKLFENKSYPISLEEGVVDNLFKQIDELSFNSEFDFYEKLGKFSFDKINNLFNFSFICDLAFSILRFNKKFNLSYCKLESEIALEEGNNMYIENATPINYGIGTNSLGLKGEKVSILTGANSGGKTTLLELILQAQILTTLGLGISVKKSSSVSLFDEVIYLKKFTGTAGSGAFEQTIRQLLNLLNSKSSKLILIDEFEAVTEPGAAAKILLTFLEELTKRDVLCVGVSHLGQEIKEFILEKEIKGIRLDGISATGLSEDGKLITNHQPTFYELGKSTPELILKRVLQDEKFWKNKGDDVKDLLSGML